VTLAPSPRNDEASDVFDAAASVSTRLFGNTCALSCRLLICAAMCHRLVKRYVAAKERCSQLAKQSCVVLQSNVPQIVGCLLGLCDWCHGKG
jgi:hypothetical protein